MLNSNLMQSNFKCLYNSKYYLYCVLYIYIRVIKIKHFNIIRQIKNLHTNVSLVVLIKNIFKNKL